MKFLASSSSSSSSPYPASLPHRRAPFLFQRELWRVDTMPGTIAIAGRYYPDRFVVADAVPMKVFSYLSLLTRFTASHHPSILLSFFISMSTFSLERCPSRQRLARHRGRLLRSLLDSASSSSNKVLAVKMHLQPP